MALDEAIEEIECGTDADRILQFLFAEASCEHRLLVVVRDGAWRERQFSDVGENRRETVGGGVDGVDHAHVV